MTSVLVSARESGLDPVMSLSSTSLLSLSLPLSEVVNMHVRGHVPLASGFHSQHGSLQDWT